MAKSSDLIIRLNADTGKFESGFKNAEASAKAFERELAKLEAQQREMAKLEAQAYREQQQRDEAKERAIREMARLEAAAYREERQRQEAKQRAIQELGDAERQAYAEQARRDAAAARRQEQLAEQERRRMERRREAMADIGRAQVAAGAALVAGLLVSVRAAVEWESAWTGVQKTVNGTEAEMADLEKQLRAMSGVLPVSSTEIANVAAAAGQLGIERSNVAAFTKTMVDLGVSTNLSSEEAATTLARLMNIMGTSQADVRRLGSTIVDLGNNFATTEQEIAAMALRIAGAGKTIGLSEADVLGFAAALSSVGIEAEAGGSSISTLLINMAVAVSEGGSDLEGFARTAGVSVAEFKRLFKDDAAGAFTAFETGLNGVITSGGDAFAVLEDLGITEIRQRDAVLRLANNYTGLRDSLGLANNAWIENNALTVESEKRYATAASKFQLAKNALNELGIELGAELLPMVVQGTEAITGLTREVAGMPDEMKTALVVVGTLGAGILGVTGSAALAAPALARLAENLTLLGRSAGVARALSATATVLAGPWGVAIAGATVALGFLVSKHIEAKNRVHDLTEAIRADSGVVAENTRQHMAKQLADDGTLRRAKDLGLSLPLITSAYLGNKDALAELTGEYHKAKDAADRRAAADAATLEQISAGTNLTEGRTQAERDAAAAEIARVGTLGELVRAAEQSSGQTAEATAAAEDYVAAQEEVERASAGAAESIEELGARVGLTEDEFTKLTESMAEQIAGFIDFNGTYTTLLQQRQQAEQEAAQKAGEAAGKTADAWKDAGKNAKVSFRDFVAELEKQVEAQDRYVENISLLAGRVSTAALQKIIEMGPTAAPLVADAIANGTQEGFDRLSDLAARGSASTFAGIQQQIVSAQPKLTQAARQLGQSTADYFSAALGRGEITAAEAIRRIDAIIAAADFLPQTAAVLGQETADRYSAGLRDGSLTVQDVVHDIDLSLAKLPTDTTTTLKVDGKDRSIRDIDALKTALNNVPNRTVTLTTLLTGNIVNANLAKAAADPRYGYGVLKAQGGPISGPGGPTDDRIPAWLSDGEYVIKASETKKHRRLLDLMNSGQLPADALHFAVGGPVLHNEVQTRLPSMNAINSAWRNVIAGPAKSMQAAADAAADAADNVGSTALGGGTGPGGWQWQIATLRKQFPGLGLNSAFRPGSKTVSGNASYHSRGRAVDVPPRMDVFNWLLANYGRTSPEIIYSPAGGRQIKNGAPHLYSGAVRAMHFNHVHWAYDQGGVASGTGLLPKLTPRPERVLSPEQTESFDRLVDVLGGGRYATGGLVVQMPSKTTGLQNTTDTAAYLRQAMTEVLVKVDDRELRRATTAYAAFNSAAVAAQKELAAAKATADEFADAARDAVSAYERDQGKLQSSIDDVTAAEKAATAARRELNEATKAKDTDKATRARENLAQAEEKLGEVWAANRTAQGDVAVSYAHMIAMQGKADQASQKLTAATAKEASAAVSASAAKDRQAAAEQKLNDAKAAALAYAKRIAAAAMSGSELTGLFSATDVVRGLEYAQKAYAASVEQAYKTTDPTEYQSKIDQLAEAGQRLQASQAANGASYATQRETIAATRIEVEKLALSYGFTSEQARALAESSVPLMNSGETLVASLERQLKAVVGFSQSISTLRSLGLSQGLIDQILEAGPQKGYELAQELISGGKGMVDRLNALQRELEAASNKLGQTAATSVYGVSTKQTGTTATTPTSTLPSLGTVKLPGVTLRARGGYVTGPGGPTDDLVPAMLSAGEFVMSAAATRGITRPVLEGMNARRSVGTPSRPAPVTVIVQAPEAPPVSTIGSIFGSVTVADPGAADLLWRRAGAVAGPLGVGGGR
ncbi:phage tail tape measure protein [Kineococcus gynurae]|uniref:Phage tail tape measure protein n=1 Tax=Kineococcus gynurae TaxID=452979 RepID=A0ABV5LWY8_9ACTN